MSLLLDPGLPGEASNLSAVNLRSVGICKDTAYVPVKIPLSSLVPSIVKKYGFHRLKINF